MVVSTQVVLPFFGYRNIAYIDPTDTAAAYANKLNADYSGTSSSNLFVKGTVIMMKGG